jgi:hypothetical protein
MVINFLAVEFNLFTLRWWEKVLVSFSFSHITFRLVALTPSGDLFDHAKDLFV